MKVPELLRVKIDLLLEGVAVDDRFKLHKRAYMDSISEGVNLRLSPNIVVTASLNPYSNYILRSTINGFELTGPTNTYEVTITTVPSLEELYTSDKMPLDKIGTFQLDRARISAFKGCIFDVQNLECTFCEIGGRKKIRRNKISHIHEFVKYVEEMHPHIRHYLISGGTPADKSWGHYIEVCNTIRNLTAKPIYAMFSPPPNLNFIDRYISAGVGEMAINLELYDERFAQEVIPAKAYIGRDQYFETMEYAVTKLGSTGNVRSILIAGIEPYERTLEGVRELAKRGVMPMLSIFKPISNTKMANHQKPKLNDLLELWIAAQGIAEDYGLTLGPTCCECQNNTLAYPLTELHN